VSTRRLSLPIITALVIVSSGCSLSGTMSANDVASHFEKTAPTMLDVSCTTSDTNGWKYACSYTDRDSGARMKVGANVKGKIVYGTGAVAAADQLPPAP
jgi:hypothetical protein